MKAALVCFALSACEVAGHSSARPPELRLTERSHGSPPPTLAPPSYPLDERELLGASALPLGSVSAPAPRIITTSLAEALPAISFVPGRSYRFTFSARLLGAAEAKLGIKFRTVEKASFRTFQERVTATGEKQYQLEFVAPAFAAAAELAIDVSGAGLALSAMSLRMRAPIARTEPVSSWAASFVPDGYGLVFNDEFNGAELSRQRWFTRYIYGSESVDRLNKENSHYTDNGNHRVAGGVLYLTAKQMKLGQPSGINYESGMIRSDFTVRYGFLEARVKMPGGLGVWPAFWLNSDVSEQGALTWPPEIDLFEFVNNGKEDKLDMLHVAVHGDAPGQKPQNTYVHPRFDARIGDYTAPFKFNEGWHTIGAEWTAQGVTWFVDGLKVVSTTFEWRTHDGSLAPPAHVLFNLGIGDEWAGRHGIDNGAFPQALALDWVRVYQRLKPD